MDVPGSRALLNRYAKPGKFVKEKAIMIDGEQWLLKDILLLYTTWGRKGFFIKSL